MMKPICAINFGNFLYKIFIGIGSLLGFVSTFLNLKREIRNRPKVFIEIIEFSISKEQNITTHTTWKYNARIKFSVFNDGNAPSSYFEFQLQLFRCEKGFMKYIHSVLNLFWKKECFAEKITRLNQGDELRPGAVSTLILFFEFDLEDRWFKKIDANLSMRASNHKKVTAKFRIDDIKSKIGG